MQFEFGLESEIINKIAECGEDGTVVRKRFLEMLLDIWSSDKITYDQVNFLCKNNLLDNFRCLHNLLVGNERVAHEVFVIIDRELFGLREVALPIETVVKVKDMDILCSAVSANDLVNFLADRTQEEFDLFFDHAVQVSKLMFSGVKLTDISQSIDEIIELGKENQKSIEDMPVVKESGRGREGWCGRLHRQCSADVKSIFGF